MKTITLCVLLLFGCSSFHAPKKEKSFHSTDPDSRWAKTFGPMVREHPGETGVVPVVDGHEAFNVRVLSVRKADHSIDLQYFIWKDDEYSRLLLKEVVRAADRGVHVRFLLDFITDPGTNAALKFLDDHPRIEVRLINPSWKFINHRMHNKSFTVDNTISIVGGRNIGEGYFQESKEHNYLDYDVFLIGPAVEEVSVQFDKYWNSDRSFPWSGLDQSSIDPRDVKEVGEMVHMGQEEAIESKFFNSVRPFWGRARVLYDSPDKLKGKQEENLTSELRPGIMNVEKELILVSPYFIPGEKGMKSLKELRKRNVRVVVVTNSLLGNDNLGAFVGYKKYRRDLLKAGIEIFEVKSAGHGIKKEARPSQSSGLHGKMMIQDRKRMFVGSMNVDPRSRTLNTEMGIMMYVPEMARHTAKNLLRNIPQISFELGYEDHHFIWIERRSSTIKVYDEEPGSSWWKTFKGGMSSILIPEQML